jgi:uroporphyrinogen-III decarboxylase
MTHWERLEAALAGKPVDHVPVSLWRRFPVIDLDPAKLAEGTLHDRQSELDLAGAKGRFAGLLAGGLDQDGTLLHGPVEAIQREVRDAIAQTGGRRLLVAPGCVAPIATPDAHYRAVVEAATGMLP